MGVPRVDFYITESATEAARLQLVCRLVDKAYAAGHPTLVLGDDRRVLATLDDLLWTSLEGSFIPHEIALEGPDAAPEHTRPEAPVLLATRAPDDFPQMLLINLGATIPEVAAAFARVIEVPGADPASRQQARDRFRAYRRLGAAPTTHQVGGQSATARPL